MLIVDPAQSTGLPRGIAPFSVHGFLCAPGVRDVKKKKPDAFLTSRRARECGCLLSCFLLDTHVAQLIRIDVRDEQVRASEGEEQEQKDCDCDNEHVRLLSYINHYVN